ncbi:indolepyruvate ferredoxin oxidoreductase family protein, partial [Weissella cibaria]|nr:indolepyruvate ferredoxin oxidoreductase family protein [Weissella cibaria]
IKLKFHMAPPLLAKKDDEGHLKKMEIGGWMFPLLKLVAKLRVLRGTPLDIFGMTAARKMERRLIRDYENRMTEILKKLTAENYDLAVKLAAYPADIRGFGHVKEQAIRDVEDNIRPLLDDFHNRAVTTSAAA